MTIFSRYVEAVGPLKTTCCFWGSLLQQLRRRDQKRSPPRVKRDEGHHLTGKMAGGKMDGLADVEIRLFRTSVMLTVFQEIHIKVIHILILADRKEMG